MLIPGIIRDSQSVRLDHSQFAWITVSSLGSLSVRFEPGINLTQPPPGPAECQFAVKIRNLSNLGSNMC
jgi:hypothetical protein